MAKAGWSATPHYAPIGGWDVMNKATRPSMSSKGAYNSFVEDFTEKAKRSRDVSIENLESEIMQLQSQIEGAKTFAPFRVALLQAQLDEVMERYRRAIEPLRISMTTRKGPTIGGRGAERSRAEREAKRSEMKSKQAEKADAKKLREIEQKGRDLLKTRDDYATRPGYGEEVARLNEQLAELAFERDYLAGRSPTLTTAEERRRKQAESESEMAGREALTQQRLTGIEREKEADKVRREVSTWIARNPNNPALAEIQKLLSQSKMSGVDSLAIVLQAKALADKEAAEVKERARLQTERLTAMQERQNDSQAHTREMKEFVARERTGEKGELQRRAAVKEIQTADAKIAGLRAMIEQAKSADFELEPKLASNIPGAERDLAGHIAAREELLRFYEANYGQYTEKAMTGGASSAAAPASTQPQSQWQSAEDVIAAYQAGNLPREMALNILIEQFGYEP